MTNLQVVQDQPVRRVSRRPTHNFYLRQRAWDIQMTCIAPVLPGETLNNAVMQARIVTDPIENPIIGWWAEHYFFYVKHRDLDGRDDFAEMMLDQNKDLSAYHEAADPRYYHAAGGINWGRLCVKRIVEEYFRNEGEAWDVATSATNMPMASIAQESWLDSVTNDAEVASFDTDLTDVGSPGGAAVLTSEIESEMRAWQFMRMQGMTDMSYEDYLATFGMKSAKEELHKPELLRYIRNWTYPSNTVDPSTGTPTSACSWGISERIDKKRMFREPGFIIGLCVVRPKVYLTKQTSTATRLMDDAFSWLPAMLQNEAASSLKEVAALAEPLSGNTDSYWVDIKDLLLYGEQFVSLNLSGATAFNEVALPTAALEKRYASTADADSLFVNAVGGFDLIRQDGVVNFDIAGSQIDTTPGNIIGA